MNIQKIHLIKDRKIILKRVLELCRMKIDVNKIAIVGIVVNGIDLFLLCDEKDTKKFSEDYFRIQTPNCGKCRGHIKSFESLKRDLLVDENNWFNDGESIPILDLSHKYKNIIENPNKKFTIWDWFKNLF